MLARELLHQARIQLEQAGCDTARLDAELLLLFVWGLSKTALIIQMHDEVPEQVTQDFQALIKRRILREPVAYITGVKAFWSYEFLVTRDVLIPRPETEHLIESVLKYFPNQNQDVHMCDIGTGSGCIAVTLAKEYPHAHVTACDISQAALDVARQNAKHLEVEASMSFYAGDLYQALPSSAKFDVIVSNPPYVSLSEMDKLEAELDYEPRQALTDEKTGLTLLDALLQDAHFYLHDGGVLVLESGLCGMPKTPDTMIKLEDYTDLAGNFRGSVFRKT